MSPHIGVVFVHRIGAPQREEFFQRIIGGLDDALGDAEGSLLVARVGHLEEELAMYAHWQATKAVDAVILKDLVAGDRRPEHLQALGIPTVALCDPSQQGHFGALCFDNAGAMRSVLKFLIGLGHTRIARITGPAAFVHTQVRSKSFDAVAEASHLNPRILVGDYSERCGHVLTAQLLSTSPVPTAIVYDNDLMAVGGQRAAQSMAFSPADVSLLAWDDSLACQLASPDLTALGHDVAAMGGQLARLALDLLATGRAGREPAAPPSIIRRGSTAAPRSSGLSSEPNNQKEATR